MSRAPVLAFVLATSLSCRRSSEGDAVRDAPVVAVKATSAASATAREATSIDAAPPGAVEAVAPVIPMRELPSRERLLAPFHGTPAHGFVGVVAFGRGSAPGLRKIVTIPDGGEVSMDTPVLVASFTKLWVAIAALRLVERNELSLDETIRTALPALAKHPWADSTVRELLTHTSRVPEFATAGSGYYQRADVDFTKPVEALEAHLSPDLTEKRGIYKYRNAEAALVGAILASRTGSSAEQVLANEVFGPARMTHSGLLVGRPPPGLDVTPVGRLRPQNFFTAGAGYASPADLLAFFEALGGETLLREASKTTLFEGVAERGYYGAFGCWAYPFARGDAGTALLVERNGSFGNVRLFSAFFPEERRAIVAWSRDPVDIPRPRVAKGLGASLARLALD